MWGTKVVKLNEGKIKANGIYFLPHSFLKKYNIYFISSHECGGGV